MRPRTAFSMHSNILQLSLLFHMQSAFICTLLDKVNVRERYPGIHGQRCLNSLGYIVWKLHE